MEMTTKNWMIWILVMSWVSRISFCDGCTVKKIKRKHKLLYVPYVLTGNRTNLCLVKCHSKCHHGSTG